MTEIPKEALERAAELANIAAKKDGRFGGYTAGNAAGFGGTAALARYIADVSEKAKKARAAHMAGASFYHRLPTDCAMELGRVQDDLASLILSPPEDDLKEAREICARDAEEQGCPDVADRYRTGVSDSSMPMRCTLAALRKGRE